MSVYVVYEPTEAGVYGVYANRTDAEIAQVELAVMYGLETDEVFISEVETFFPLDTTDEVWVTTDYQDLGVVGVFPTQEDAEAVAAEIAERTGQEFEEIAVDNRELC